MSLNTSSNDIQPASLSDAPIELVLQIFEYAAAQDDPTAASLSRVSKAVQDLVEPILYQSVRLRDEHAMQFFQETMRLKSPTFLSTHIKSLTCSSMYYETDFILLNNTCKGIQTISLFSGEAHRLKEIDLPNLRTVVVHSILRESVFHGNWPIWNTVTHLHFTSDIPGHFYDLPTPTLTHLSVCYRVLPISGYKGLSRILWLCLESKTLEVVVIHVFDKEKLLTQEEMEEKLAHVVELDNPRVVLAPGGPLAAPIWGVGEGFQWVADGIAPEHRELPYRWDLAEEIVAKRNAASGK